MKICVLIFRLLNAEPYPSWFQFQKKGNSRKIDKFKGFTGNYLLLLWSVSGMMIVFAFLSMFRAAMMRPVMEKPIDTTKDLVLARKQPLLTFGSFWPQYLLTSKNPWERQVGKMGVSARDMEDIDALLKSLTYEAGTHSVQMTPALVGNAVSTDPWYKNKPSPIFQMSREVLRPYYLGWVLTKASPWREELNRHILQVQQVGQILLILYCIPKS